MENSEKIISQFDDNNTVYEQFRSTLTQLITDLLDFNNLKPHHIASRLKDRESLLKK